MADGVVITGRVIGAERVVERFRVGIPAEARARTGRTIRELGLTLERKVKLEKLEGQVLHRRSGRLVRSINTTFREGDDIFTSSTGTSLVYGRAWELGFHGTVNVRSFIRKHQAGNTFYGRSTRAQRNSWDASGVGVSHGVTIVREHTRRVDMNARPFLRPALDEMRPEIRDRLAVAMRGL